MIAQLHKDFSIKVVGRCAHIGISDYGQRLFIASNIGNKMKSIIGYDEVGNYK